MYKDFFGDIKLLVDKDFFGNIKFSIGTLVVLSYLHQKKGPIVYYSYPENFYEKLSTRLAKIEDFSIFSKDERINEVFFSHVFEFKISLNYYFEVHSDWARKNKEMLMISVITDNDKSIWNSIPAGIEQTIKLLLSAFSEKLKSSEEIYTAFYINDINKFEEQERKIIYKNDALVRSWIEDMHWQDQYYHWP